ncbi:MAG TPA: DUF448 domain-containing protein [Candidatus Saccharimonadia bacterium]|nr:DUF448 domain-containing protein [Candidatus Saccharimonadia bacterium]
MTATPTRSCRVCRRRLPKAELLRWTVVEGELRPDRAQTAPGRGYYSCSEKCAEILPRTLKRKK